MGFKRVKLVGRPNKILDRNFYALRGVLRVLRVLGPVLSSRALSLPARSPYMLPLLTPPFPSRERPRSFSPIFIKIYLFILGLNLYDRTRNATLYNSYENVTRV